MKMKAASTVLRPTMSGLRPVMLDPEFAKMAGSMEGVVPRVRVSPALIPLSIDLPDSWVVWPSSERPSDVALVAQRFDQAGASLATITLDQVTWPLGESMRDLGDELVMQAESAYSSVQLLSREEGGEAGVETLKQAVVARVGTVQTPPQSIVQEQMLIGVVDDHDESKRVVIRIALTLSPELRDAFSPEFWAIVGTMEPGAS